MVLSSTVWGLILLRPVLGLIVLGLCFFIIYPCNTMWRDGTIDSAACLGVGFLDEFEIMQPLWAPFLMLANKNCWWSSLTFKSAKLLHCSSVLRVTYNRFWWAELVGQTADFGLNRSVLYSWFSNSSSCFTIELLFSCFEDWIISSSVEELFSPLTFRITAVLGSFVLRFASTLTKFGGERPSFLF